MDYFAIKQICRRLPKAPPNANADNPTDTLPVVPGSGYTVREARDFLSAYGDPAFGWKTAMSLVRAEAQAFPLFPSAKLKYVWMAWLYLRDREKHSNDIRFEPVRMAESISRSFEGRATRDVLDALLITEDATVAAIARATGLEPGTVECYDALFRNSLDRTGDYLFFRNLVYPDTRMVEFLSDYLQKGNMGMILTRLGYNTNFDCVRYIAGFRSPMATSSMNSGQAQEQYVTHVMQTASMMTLCGFLNFDKHHVVLHMAKSLAAASKLGGEKGVQGLMQGNFGNYAMAEIDRVSSDLQEHTRRVAMRDVTPQ